MPAGVAFIVRMFVKEPERWQAVAKATAHATPARAVLARSTAARPVSGFAMAVDRARHVVELQRVHPTVSRSGSRTPRPSGSGSIRRRPGRWAIEWKTIATYMFNLGGLIGTLLTHPRRQGPGPPHDVRDRTSRRRPSPSWPPSASICRRRRACTCTASSASRCSACSAASRTTCPSCSRPACAAPAPASATTSAASSPPAGRSWSASSLRAAPMALTTAMRPAVLGRPGAARRRAVAAVVVETKDRALA